MNDLNLTNEFDKTEEQGKQNILKYFDRIHDKLFTFNNIMIVGFFALSKIETGVNIRYILIPISNLIILIFIDWWMMELSRTESYIKEIPINQLNKKLYSKYGVVTWLSFVSIITTTIVTAVFIYLLFL